MLLNILLEKRLSTHACSVISNSKLILEIYLHFSDNDGNSGRDFNKKPESETAMVSDQQGNNGECIVNNIFKELNRLDITGTAWQNI